MIPLSKLIRATAEQLHPADKPVSRTQAPKGARAKGDGVTTCQMCGDKLAGDKWVCQGCRDEVKGYLGEDYIDPNGKQWFSTVMRRLPLVRTYPYY